VVLTPFSKKHPHYAQKATVCQEILSGIFGDILGA
jgi:hypothetical protein